MARARNVNEEAHLSLGFRLSFAASREQLNNGLDRLEQLLKESKK